MPIDIIKYTPLHREEWNTFTHTAVNSTFLFEREYMEYHSDRFTDHSLMFYRNGKLTALLPADIKGKTLQSHGGLTYGGLIFQSGTGTTDVMELFEALTEYMRSNIHAEKLIYKPIPQIYCSQPAEETLYALFRSGASLTSRSISTTIETRNRGRVSELRRRGAKRAEKVGATCGKSEDYAAFWKVLENTLMERHHCSPTHTLEEIKLLQSRFPENIKLYTTTLNGEIIAGTVVYETKTVAHLQYIAASPAGRDCGALDILITHLIYNIYPDKKYIDFGISTEEGGRVLNEGLIRQKEGFGGSAVVYDTYELNI